MTDQRTQPTIVREPVDLDEAQKLCDEATREPWGWRGYDDGSIELRALHSGGLRLITSHRSEPCTAITCEGDWVLLEHACEDCVAAYNDPDGWEASSSRRCLKPENLDTVWAWFDKGFIKPLNEWAVREVPYRSDVADVTHPDARFVARSRELLPRVVAELGEYRTQRDENLANIRRIDDLRIAETARLQRELDTAEEVIEAAEAVRMSGGSLLAMSALSTALAAHKRAKAGEGA